MLNRLFEQSKNKEPAIGMGGTLFFATDREPVTIVGINYFKGGAKAGQVKSVDVTRDKATRTDSNGMSEQQSYTFETDPDATPVTYLLRKDGTYRAEPNGTILVVGVRGKYYDFTF